MDNRSGAGGMKLVVHDDGGEVPAAATLDCPLCAAVVPPPPPIVLPMPHPLTHAVRAIPAAHVAARTAGPLPARGPPARS